MIFGWYNGVIMKVCCWWNGDVVDVSLKRWGDGRCFTIFEFG